jgi:hypothetical protein
MLEEEQKKKKIEIDEMHQKIARMVRFRQITAQYQIFLWEGSS